MNISNSQLYVALTPLISHQLSQDLLRSTTSNVVSLVGERSVSIFCPLILTRRLFSPFICNDKAEEKRRKKIVSSCRVVSQTGLSRWSLSGALVRLWMFSVFSCALIFNLRVFSIADTCFLTASMLVNS